MISKKGLVIGLAAALAVGVSGVASATMINVDGVSWDPTSILDLQIHGLNMRESSVSAVGDVLHGYGQVGSINGNTGFCASCDLAFNFDYTVKDITGNQVVFELGTVNFLVQPAGTFSETNPASAFTGTPWLTLTGHTGFLVDFTTTGTLFSTINGTISQPQSGSNGQGFLDATGGPAAKYMQTHTQADGLGGFADFSINSSFLFDGINICADGICYPINGTANLIGKSRMVVPEPGALGMLGLGMGMLGVFFWRRRKEADNQA